MRTGTADDRPTKRQTHISKLAQNSIFFKTHFSHLSLFLIRFETKRHVAPEIFLKRNKVDIWCVGSFVYSLLVGQASYEAKALRNNYSKMKNRCCRLRKSDDDVVPSMLSSNPSFRATDELNHMQQRDRVITDLEHMILARLSVCGRINQSEKH
uniref:Protein kinase domain-containing protein n=1 Tax=Glossina pallidipes TaxID=7398 RepID=A0A1B0GGQ0_GLOPL